MVPFNSRSIASFFSIFMEIEIKNFMHFFTSAISFCFLRLVRFRNISLILFLVAGTQISIAQELQGQELAWVQSYASLVQSIDGLVDPSFEKQADEFAFYSVDLDEEAVSQSLITYGGRLLLPSVKHSEPWQAVITDIDSQTAKDGTIVYTGDVLNTETQQVLGKFTYAHTKGSHPYLYVSTGQETYEIFVAQSDARTNQREYVLKLSVGGVFPGRIDFDDDELAEMLANLESQSNIKAIASQKVTSQNTEVREANKVPKGHGVSTLSSGCVVDLGVGYTVHAYNRNNSIASSIASWAADMSTMLQDIGVTCAMQLAGTKKFNYSESPTSIIYDVIAIDNPGVMRTWKNSTVNADLFIMVTSNGEPHNDPYHGIAETFGTVDTQSCASSYDSNRQCGQWAVVRDDYALSLRVFAHEAAHLVGAAHQYAYGGSNYYDSNFKGAGFSSQNNGAEVSTLSGHYKVTTVMSNPPANIMCSESRATVNPLFFCGYRLPFFASQSISRLVRDDAIPWNPWTGFTYTYRYFPEFYRAYETAPYSVSSPSMQSLLQSGMANSESNQ